MSAYKVLFEPTPLGVTSFGWKAGCVSRRNSYDEALREAYELNSEEAPDFTRYGRYKVEPSDERNN